MMRRTIPVARQVGKCDSPISQLLESYRELQQASWQLALHLTIASEDKAKEDTQANDEQSHCAKDCAQGTAFACVGDERI